MLVKRDKPCHPSTGDSEGQTRSRGSLSIQKTRPPEEKQWKSAETFFSYLDFWKKLTGISGGMRYWLCIYYFYLLST